MVGSCKSKELLLQAAARSQQCSQQLGHLQILGCALGINEWVKTFDARLSSAGRERVVKVKQAAAAVRPEVLAANEVSHVGIV